MKQWAGSLSGYKTYIAGGLAIVGSWAAFLTGEEIAGQPPLSLEATIMLTIGAVLAMTVRNGIATVGK